MINNWKLGLKMLRHGYGLMMNIIMVVAYLLLGIGCLLMDFFTDFIRVGVLGQVVLLCIGMVPVQMLSSLNVSNFVLTSRRRKKMQTSVPAVLSWSCTTLLYLVIVLIRAVMILYRPEIRSSVCNELLILGPVAMAIMLYSGIAYKYFVLATILLVPVICIPMNMGIRGNLTWSAFNGDNASLVLSAAIGLVCIGVGAIGEYLISLLLYKKPMSKMAQVAPLRKEL